jgi:hypothetical protein
VLLGGAILKRLSIWVQVKVPLEIKKALTLKPCYSIPKLVLPYIILVRFSTLEMLT